MAISLYSNNVISILNVGNDTVEATALSNMSIKEEIVEGGFSNQKNQYFIMEFLLWGLDSYQKLNKLRKLEGFHFKDSLGSFINRL